MDIKYLYENTTLTLQQIADRLNAPFDRVFKYSKRNYSKEHRLQRKRICYRNSKLGALNPMSGKIGSLHHGYVGDVSDCKGYLMRIKPQWYTGRKGSRHVFVHSIVVCEHLKLTEVPKGWVVHHCDFNPHNNSFDNLVMMLTSDHMRLHKHLAGATTISKESTLKWVETYGTPWKRDDIVCSTQECVAASNVAMLT
jgi:hypothetical protein